MQEEIFGPILPVVAINDIDSTIRYVNERPKPLALYWFGKDKKVMQRILNETRSGGVTINDTLLHAAVEDLPFGGIGESGAGAYHGRDSFDTFSHKKSISKTPFAFDLPIKYPPYKNKVNMIKKLMR